MPVELVDRLPGRHCRLTSASGYRRQGPDGSTVFSFPVGDRTAVLATPTPDACPCPRCVVCHRRHGRDATPDDPGAGVPVSELPSEHPEEAWLASVDGDRGWAVSCPTPHPSCPHCSVPGRSRTGQLPPAAFVAPRVGTVRHLTTAVTTGVVAATAVFENPAWAFDDRLRPFARSGGVAPSEPVAETKAVVEAVERYAALWPVEPTTETQAPRVVPRYIDETALGRGVVTLVDAADRDYAVPAGLVRLFRRTGDGVTATVGTTSGRAAGFTRARAFDAAVAEAVERHHLMWFWYADRRAVELDGLTAEPDEPGDSVVLSLTPSAAYDCVLAAWIAPDDGVAVVAADAAPDREAARRGATHELLGALDDRRTGDTVSVTDPTAVTSAADHVRYYQRPTAARRLRRILADAVVDTESGRVTADAGGGATIPTASSGVSDADTISATVDTQVLRRTATPPPVRATPVHVVETVTPDLVPLLFGSQLQALDRSAFPDPVPDPEPHPFP